MLVDGRHGNIISIHALHEESDLSKSRHTALTLISIHALHEESDMDDRRAGIRRHISIHALHEESDRMVFSPHRSDIHFNPRSP